MSYADCTPGREPRSIAASFCFSLTPVVQCVLSRWACVCVGHRERKVRVWVVRRSSDVITRWSLAAPVNRQVSLSLSTVSLIEVLSQHAKPVCPAVYCWKWLPSVLWHCWLGVRKSIQPAKYWVMRCWHGCLFGVRCKWYIYDPATTVTPSYLALLYPAWFCLSDAGLPRLSWKRGRSMGVCFLYCWKWCTSFLSIVFILTLHVMWKKDVILLLQEHRWVAHLLLWGSKWIHHMVCDTWPLANVMQTFSAREHCHCPLAGTHFPSHWG